MSENMIVVSEEKYRRLLQRDVILSALEAGGVDNWEWYNESLRDAGVFDDEEESEEEIYG